MKIYDELVARGLIAQVTDEKEIRENRKNQRDLWRFGISGDNPIILVRIRNVNDVYVIKELINAIEYFVLKNIKVDLVIIDEEKGTEKYSNEKIIEYINSKNISYLISANGGIHLVKLSHLEKGDINLLYSCSDIIWEANNGFLEELLS